MLVGEALETLDLCLMRNSRLAVLYLQDACILHRTLSGSPDVTAELSRPVALPGLESEPADKKSRYLMRENDSMIHRAGWSRQNLV